MYLIITVTGPRRYLISFSAEKVNAVAFYTTILSFSSLENNGITWFWHKEILLYRPISFFCMNSIYFLMHITMFVGIHTILIRFNLK